MLGYIVEWRGVGGMYFCRAKYALPGGCLFIGRHVTLFTTRRQAEAAIDATVAFARRQDIEWKRGEYRIRAIRSKPPA